jgi:hypothetical protein
VNKKILRKTCDEILNNKHAKALSVTVIMTVENKTGISFFKLISKSATIKRGEVGALNQSA